MKFNIRFSLFSVMAFGLYLSAFAQGKDGYGVPKDYTNDPYGELKRDREIDKELKRDEKNKDAAANLKEEQPKLVSMKFGASAAVKTSLSEYANANDDLAALTEMTNLALKLSSPRDRESALKNIGSLRRSAESRSMDSAQMFLDLKLVQNPLVGVSTDEAAAIEFNMPVSADDFSIHALVVRSSFDGRSRDAATSVTPIEVDAQIQDDARHVLVSPKSEWFYGREIILVLRNKKTDEEYLVASPVTTKAPQFVGTAFPANTDCGLEPGDATYDVVLQGKIESNRIKLRILELEAQKNSGPAKAFASLFTGLSLAADVSDHRILSSGVDTVFKVSGTDSFDVITTIGSISDDGSEIMNLKIERQTKIRSSVSQEELECTVSLFIPKAVLKLEK